MISIFNFKKTSEPVYNEHNIMDAFLSNSLPNYNKTHIDEFVEALNSKDNKVFSFYNEDDKEDLREIKIFNSFRSNLNIINKNFVFSYKQKASYTNNIETFIGFLIWKDGNLYDVYTKLPNDFSKLDKYENNENFTCDLLIGDNKIANDLVSKDLIIKNFGESLYKEFINRSLKEENLLVKNSIYKIY